MALPMPTLIYPVRLSEQTSPLKQKPRASPLLYRIPSQGHGLCKHATTILGDQGGLVYLVTDTPKLARCKEVPPHVTYKGARPLHRTTLKMHATEHPSYDTTNQKFHGGKIGLCLPERDQPYPSQHFSQFDLFHRTNLASPSDVHEMKCSTHYDEEFSAKGTGEGPARLHFPSFLNKMTMNEGSGVKSVMLPPKGDQRTGRFWTQYNRVHNRLGAALGPGVPRERPVLSAHNPITGSYQGPSTKEDNRRISGNRVLYHNFGRRGAETTSFF
ncbi:hypothetical protein CAPTEDRAFT_226857 [Capitella teleta]|uniref:Protein phosphatase 1 regulatory subunit 32 n=1 Tax=Capitella teleta TaxID=283909 RepID=R7U179_CAPTE|nr:hypothetical protein CAPTEDRAFT_226857 [Capitella teleta]|eukprot:ELT99744.1 hypothetical protein CAPTEDRAFT_226857 [Capitella teleta]